ncbi:hypothetical protein BO226_16355 [Rhodococcus sp. 2G]|nr:hypothetical protein BO226_16355 [Rhodococcus sp. 2G]
MQGSGKASSTSTNIFVLGLTDIQRKELETVRGADQVSFHGLLDYETLVEPDEYVFDDDHGDRRVHSESWQRRTPRDLV